MTAETEHCDPLPPWDAMAYFEWWFGRKEDEWRESFDKWVEDHSDENGLLSW